jgi:ParB family transcriptional regulator, chromosome partitioning protein
MKKDSPSQTKRAANETTSRDDLPPHARQPHPNYDGEVQLAKIVILKGRRSVDDAKVAELAKSISEIGLLQPIGVTKDYTLIYGRTRLAAYQLLNRDSIPTLIHEADDLHLELAEIDENIVRHRLTAIEEAQAMARRKEIYEVLHPETQSVTKRGGPGRGKKTGAKSAPVSFAEDTAAKTGQSRRSVQELVMIGQNLDSKAAKTLADTPLANKKGKLAELSRMPPEQQRQVAKALADGETGRTKQKAANDPKQRTAKNGLKGLSVATAAAKKLGIYPRLAKELESIKIAFEEQAAGGTEPEEETEWRA